MTLYNLLTCPAPVRAGFIAVERDATGQLQALGCGLACSTAPTRNLARIRHRAARLGASEILVHDKPGSTGTLALRRLVRDLAAGAVASLVQTLPPTDAIPDAAE